MKAPHIIGDVSSNGYPGGNHDILISNGYNERRDDFSEYLWMEDMESFDKQVMAELEEEEEFKQCMAEMLAEEEARDTTYYNPEVEVLVEDVEELCQRPEDDLLMDGMAHLRIEDIISRSTLNPNAEEFVPGKNSSSSDLSDSSEASDR